MEGKNKAGKEWREWNRRYTPAIACAISQVFMLSGVTWTTFPLRLGQKEEERAIVVSRHGTLHEHIIGTQRVR